jgi:uncharacterized protein YaaN involved in tellurite resistance
VADTAISTSTAVAPLVLTPPQAVTVVTPDQAAQPSTLAPDATKRLDGQVSTFIDDLLKLDIHSNAFQEKLGAVHTFGNADIQASAAVSNRMMERPVRAMENEANPQGSTVSRGLLDLRRTIEDLDPSKQGDLFSPKTILKLIPFGSHIIDYFRKYQSAQTHLNAIIDSLYHGKDELLKDNAAIEQEKSNMWTLMGKLEQWVYLGKHIDAALEKRIDEIAATDPEKARIAREEILFAVRQKVMDLLTQLAVNKQGYLALDLVRRNNIELVKGVDRATTTTVSALRTAVIVAQALTNQKLVLDQITALNKTTGDLIEGTATMLQQQSAKIHEQAASATINIDQLKRAFDAIYQTMDTISTYRVQALASMSKTVDALSTEVTRAQTYLDRARGERVKDIVQSLPSSADDGVVNLLGGTAR